MLVSVKKPCRLEIGGVGLADPLVGEEGPLRPPSQALHRPTDQQPGMDQQAEETIKDKGHHRHRAESDQYALSPTYRTPHQDIED